MSNYLKITVDANESVNKLKKIPPIAKKIALEETSNYLIEFGGGYSLRWYPPARAQSTYTRTYTLKGGWEYQVDETRAYISNGVPYAIYPMGNPPAAKMQLLGWRGALSRVISNLPRAVAYAQKKVTAIVSSLL